MPQFTVIIPCHNQGRFLEDCLESVVAQTKRAHEIIVLNDGSTNADAEIIEKVAARYPVRLLTNKTAHGLPDARNQAIAAATTDYILPLDADDKIASHYLELARDVISANPDADIICGNGEYFGKDKGATRFPPYTPARMLLDNCIPAAAIFKKSDWLTAGGYRTIFREGWEDWDFFLTLLERGATYHHIDSVVFHYRRHALNITKSIDRNPEQKMRLYRLLLEQHPVFIEKFSKDALLLYYAERCRHRAFNKNPMIAFSRKLLRIFGKIP